MEDAIVEYLDSFGQPQSVAAIVEFAVPDAESYALVEATLEGMVAAGRIQRVQAGVHSGGQPTLEYAPLSFAG